MLIFYIMATMGLTYLIVDSFILSWPRTWLKDHLPWIGRLVRCYQCAGFWCGGLVGGLVYGWDLKWLFIYALAGAFLGPAGDAALDWRITVSLNK